MIIDCSFTLEELRTMANLIYTNLKHDYNDCCEHLGDQLDFIEKKIEAIIKVNLKSPCEAHPEFTTECARWRFALTKLYLAKPETEVSKLRDDIKYELDNVGIPCGYDGYR